MSPDKVFRVAVIVTAVTYSVYWLLPYSYGYLDPEVGSLLSCSGFKSIYVIGEYVSIALLILLLYGCWGMYFYRKIGRNAFLIAMLAATAMTPLHGVVVETAGGVMLIDIAHVASGMVLALAYFSPIRDKFY